MKHLSSQAEELEDYEKVILDLDRQNEEIQKQIDELKARKERKEKSVISDIKSSLPHSQRPRSVPTSKQLKYMKIQRKLLEDQRLLASKFVESRSAILSTFSDPEAIASLFSSNESPFQEEEPDDFELDASAREYSSDIKNTMMSLSHSLIMKCLVELNLRFALFDKQLKSFQTSSASFYRQGLFKSMQQDGDKSELLQRVAELRSREVSSRKPFLKQLEPEQVQNLFTAFRLSDQFSCKDSQRYDMYINRSGHWHNYEDSDTSSWIKATKGPVFSSNSVDNTEYFIKFGNLFSEFASSSHPLKHVNLVFEIAKVLASGGQFIPSTAIFRDLLDKLGAAKLYGYQSVVYEHLPAFSNRNSVWADGESSNTFAEKNVEHFQYLIEDDPKFLESLINYSTTRQDTTMMENFLKLLEPTPIRSLSSKNILPSFMTGTLLSRSSRQHEYFSKPIYFEKSIIVGAIQASFELKDHKAIDKLLTKLVYNSIQTENGPRVFCGGTPPVEKLMINNYPTKVLISELFNEDLLKTLGEIYLVDEDNRRCTWLAPLIQDNMKRNQNTELQNLHNKISSMLQPANRTEPNPISTVTHDTVDSNEQWRRETARVVPINFHRIDRMAPLAA